MRNEDQPSSGQTTRWVSRPDHDAEGPQPEGGADFGSRYEILETLGAGGMGKVVRAFDKVLQRHVAIKFITDPADVEAQLYLREARAQARINHDNVCKVHDVGMADGRPYVAMQLIQGHTLLKAAEHLSAREKLNLIRQAAEGLHAAHRLGLIHRDVKPSNIMVEPIAGGEWKAYVVDFGLVRDLGDLTQTSSRVITGTPQYMAPEQVRNQRDLIDWRTDVYALGATLYEALTGVAPFTGQSSAEVLVKVLGEEPRLPRHAAQGFPKDLEAVILKCLEKEPHSRYGSAKELADEIGRYLSGEPVLARPASMPTHVAKWVRRNEKLAIVSAAAVLVVLVLGGMWARTAVQSRARADAARRFGEEVTAIESIGRVGALLPLHDTRRDKALMRDRMKRIEGEMATLGRAGVGPGHYALGRGYLALHEHQKAREHLEKAWNTGYRGPEVAYALGQALGLEYQRKLFEAQGIGNKELREARVKEVEEKLRAPALQYLESGKQARTDSPAYAEGLIAFYEKRYDDAIAKAREAASQAPWLFEARKLEGDVWQARAVEDKTRGEIDRAIEESERAGEAYAAVLEVARSDTEAREAECDRLRMVFDATTRRGDPPEQALPWVIAACDDALAANPDSSQAFAQKAWVYSAAGEYQALAGTDPREVDRRGVEMAKEAIRLDPKSLNAHIALGFCFYADAEYEIEHGVDPRPSLTSAIEAFEKAAQSDPAEPSPYSNMGGASYQLASYQEEMGIDPRPALDRGIAACEKAISLQWRTAGVYNSLGAQYQLRGRFELRHGFDPRGSFGRAVASFEKAIEINAKSAAVHDNLAMAFTDLAEYEMSQDRDPEQEIRRAVESLQTAIQLQPRRPTGLLDLSTVLTIRARRKLEAGDDPRPLLEQAMEAVNKGLDLDPSRGSAWVIKGDAELLAARAAMKHGRSPQASLQAAERDYQHAHQLLPRDALVMRGLAGVQWQEAEWELANGKSPTESLQAGLQAVASAIGLRADDAEAYRLRGELLLVLARAEKLKKEELAAQALNAFGEALRINGNLKRSLEPSMKRAQELLGHPR